MSALRPTVLALLGLASTAMAGIDLKHVDLEVAVAPKRLEATVVLKASFTDLPESWTLELADTMEVKSVRCGDRDVPFERNRWKIVLDLSGLGDVREELALTWRIAGRPYVKFSRPRGGFVRTDVGEARAYVRSQYPWYPRPPDDPATYRTSVQAPEG